MTDYAIFKKAQKPSSAIVGAIHELPLSKLCNKKMTAPFGTVIYFFITVLS